MLKRLTLVFALLLVIGVVFASDWTTDEIDVAKWDTRRGIIPAGFRHGNVIARLN